MEDWNIGHKPNGGASSDRDCRRLCSICKSTDVTPHVIGLDIRYWGVGVGVRSDVDIFTTDSAGVDKFEEAV